MIGWRVTETDNKMLPVNSYAAKIFITSKDDNTLRLNIRLVFTEVLWEMILPKS